MTPRNRISSALVVFLTALLTACGGSTSGNNEGGSDDPGDDNGAGPVAAVAFDTENPTVSAGGSTTLRVTITDADEAPVNGATVAFESGAGGKLASDSATSNDNGVAKVELKAGETLATTTITARSSGITDKTNPKIVAGPPATIDLSAAPKKLAFNNEATLSLSVTDEFGNPVKGSTVRFRSAGKPSGGQFSPVSVTTDSDGRASGTYAAGNKAGDYTIQAETPGITSNSVKINIDPTAAELADLTLSTGSQSIPADGESSTFVRASVTDTSGNPVEGITVDFTTSEGELDQKTTTTNARGIAEVRLTASKTATTAELSARSGGIVTSASVTFEPGNAEDISLSAAPKSLALNDTSSVTVSVTDGFGNPVPNQTLQLQTPTNNSGGSFRNIKLTTDANGRATGTYTAGNTAGKDILLATTGSVESNTIPVSVDPEAIKLADIRLTTGSSSIPADDTSSTFVRANVTDTNGDPVEGVIVNFRTDAGSIDAQAITDANGDAQASLTAGAVATDAQITASSGGINAGTTVIFSASAPSKVQLSATPATIPLNGSTSLTVSVNDSQGNPVPNETLQLKLPSNTSGGSFDNIELTTDANGRATGNYTAGNVAGTDTLLATTGSVDSNRVDVTVDPNATKLAGITLTTGSDSIPADGTSSTFVRANVTDTNGTPVEGITVNFGTDAGSIDAQATTDASGDAQVSLTAGDTVTKAEVKASTGGVSRTTTVNFTSAQAANIALSATPKNIPLNAESQLTVTVKDDQRNPVEGQTVQLSVAPNNSDGKLTDISVNTDANGRATTMYQSGNRAGTDTIQASTGRVDSNTASITVSPDAALVGSVELTTGADNITADGLSSTFVRATVTDTNGNPVAGIAVGFSTSQGRLDSNEEPTTRNGIAETVLTSDMNLGDAVVSASTGNVTDTKAVEFVAGTPDNVKLTATPATIPLNGSAELGIRVTDKQDNPVPDEAVQLRTVTNNSGGQLDNTAVTTDANGRATAAYNAGNTAATDTLSATASGVSASPVQVIVTPDAARLNALDLKVGSDSITADGNDSTFVRATVTDVNGAPVQGVDVAFSTTKGTLDQTTATTDANGTARVDLTSGTRTIISLVSASTGGLNQSTQVAFVPGPADPANSSISANPASLPANGSATSTVTVTLADANGNPVPDGTEVALTSSAGTVNGSNPATTTRGRAQFTLQAPANQATANIGIQKLPSLKTTVEFDSPLTGNPANVQASVDPESVFVAGVGKSEQADITLNILDDAGNPIDESQYNDTSLDNVRVELVTRPSGGEFITGTNAAGQSVSSGSDGTLDVRSNDGSLTLRFQSGNRPGVIEARIKVLEFAGTDFTTAGDVAATASLPQITVASGPPHTIAFTTPNTDAISNLGGGVYSLTGRVIVTDRYGNAVPDGTAISLGLLDSVIAQGNSSSTTADSPGLSETNFAFNDFLGTIQRNDTSRGIQAGDRILVRNAEAEDKSRFVSSVTGSNSLDAQSNYQNGESGLNLAVGASLLGGEIAGEDESGDATKGRAKTKDGLATFNITYPANTDTVLNGCYGYTNGTYSTDDKRRTVPQSGQVYVVAASSDNSATAVDRDQFCFKAIAGGTLTASPTTVAGDATIQLTLTDNETEGDRIRLPFVPVFANAVIDTNVSGNFDVDVTVNNNAENGEPQTNIDGVASADIHVICNDGPCSTEDSATVTFQGLDATATVTVKYQ